MFMVLLVSSLASAQLQANYEDVDESLDQPVDQVVEVVQDSPQSNSVHVAHNNPVGSDIFVNQVGNRKDRNGFSCAIH